MIEKPKFIVDPPRLVDDERPNNIARGSVFRIPSYQTSTIRTEKGTLQYHQSESPQPLKQQSYTTLTTVG